GRAAQHAREPAGPTTAPGHAPHRPYGEQRRAEALDLHREHDPIGLWLGDRDPLDVEVIVLGLRVAHVVARDANPRQAAGGSDHDELAVVGIARALERVIDDRLARDRRLPGDLTRDVGAALGAVVGVSDHRSAVRRIDADLEVLGQLAPARARRSLQTD